MSTKKDNLKEEFQSWTGRFTMQLRKNARDTFTCLEKIKCGPEYFADLLFSYVTIQLPQRKKLREDSKAFRKEMRRLRKGLLNCADKVEYLWSKNLYGKQNLLGTHLRLQVSLKEDVPHFESLPRFLRENAEYMEFLRLFYGESNRAYLFGPDYLLLGVQKRLKSCAGTQSVNIYLADLLEAAYAASGITKKVDEETLARRLNRCREPLSKLIPNGDRERLIHYYFRQNQT